MSTEITITYKDKNYVLGFSRNTAKQIEDQGFTLDALTDRPATMIPLLVCGAFMRYNRGIKRDLVDEIFDNLVGKVGDDGKDGFINILAEMYADTVNTLMGDVADEGNAATWKVTKKG